MVGNEKGIWKDTTNDTKDFDGGMKQMWVGIIASGKKYRRGRHGKNYTKGTKQ